MATVDRTVEVAAAETGLMMSAGCSPRCKGLPSNSSSSWPPSAATRSAKGREDVAVEAAVAARARTGHAGCASTPRTSPLAPTASGAARLRAQHLGAAAAAASRTAPAYQTLPPATCCPTPLLRHRGPRAARVRPRPSPSPCALGRVLEAALAREEEARERRGGRAAAAVAWVARRGEARLAQAPRARQPVRDQPARDQWELAAVGPRWLGPRGIRLPHLLSAHASQLSSRQRPLVSWTARLEEQHRDKRVTVSPWSSTRGARRSTRGEVLWSRARQFRGSRALGELLGRLLIRWTDMQGLTLRTTRMDVH